MNRNSEVAYRFAVYAALVVLTGTLGWVLVHVGTSTPRHRLTDRGGSGAMRSRRHAAESVHMRYDSILGTIGDTPVVRLRHFGAARHEPLRQDRGLQPDGLGQGPARARGHRGRGAVRPAATGPDRGRGDERQHRASALAMVCAAKGYPLVVTMAENFSVERRRLMRFLGAKVVLTPAAQKGSGMLAKARRARHDARLVLRAPVRERSERRRALAHHGTSKSSTTSPTSRSTRG